MGEAGIGYKLEQDKFMDMGTVATLMTEANARMWFIHKSETIMC